MLVQRIALLAERLGIPLPRVAGQSLLGLLGTIRVTQSIPLVFSASIEKQVADLEPGASGASLVDTLSAVDVWTWLEVRNEEQRWRWPAPGDEPDEIVRCSEGESPPQNVAIVFATDRYALRCVRTRDGLRVLGVLSRRRAPRARLLVASFQYGAGSDTEEFDTSGLYKLLASQMRVSGRIDQRALERDAAGDREFITAVRRYLEGLRNHAVTSTPRAKYELINRRPVRLRTANQEAWPRAFSRAGALVDVPIWSGSARRFPVLDVSDDGDVITLDADDEDEEIPTHDEVTVRPNEDSLLRMREALDAIATSKDESHGRLLEALTRPEALEPLRAFEGTSSNDVTARQVEARALALNTPDIALIHGPPGTGKTTVICSIVEELVKRGQRVLLVAPTHVALDNVLERVGDRPEVTAIRLGSPDNVEPQVHRFLIQDRSKDLRRLLAAGLHEATSEVPGDDPVATVQREWAKRLKQDDAVGALLLLNANLVCATPIGIAMARGFREVEVIFDVMILDEASKATITDFLVPAARAKKWILVGDHLQLPPYVDLEEVEAIVSERAKRTGISAPDEAWICDLSARLRQHFDNRLHPDPKRRAASWTRLVDLLATQFDLDDPAVEEMTALGPDARKWREARRLAMSQADKLSEVRADALRLGAELLELQALALSSVFEHLTRLPQSRSVKLNFQHRMAPALALFSSELVYGGDYPSAPETTKLGLDIPSLEAPAIWIDTAYARPGDRYEYPRDQNWSGGDYLNPLEVDVALEVVKTCAAWAVQSWRGDPREGGRGPEAPFEIGVTSFYLKQALRLRDAIFSALPHGTDPWRRRWGRPAANGAPIEIHVSIVDRFQGREKDLMVLCTTRSNPVGNRGHVDNLNRLNVAVTRARHKRIIIGDSSTLAAQGRVRRPPGDLLVRLCETSECKRKWGRVLGGRS